jgi:hypothetical protein
MKRLKGCLGVFLVFFFGVLFGCAITAGIIHEKVIELVEGGPERITAEMVERLKKDLKLDKEQQEMLQQIAMDARIKLRTIRQSTQPEVDRTIGEAADRLRGILSADQAKKFDEIIKKGRAKWQAAAKPEETAAPADAQPPPADAPPPPEPVSDVKGETP